MIPFIKDEYALDDKVEEAGKKLVVVCFTSKDNQGVDQTFEDQNNELDDALFFKVDVEDMHSSTLVERYGPEMVPLFVILKNGLEVDRVRGADEQELRLKIH